MIRASVTFNSTEYELIDDHGSVKKMGLPPIGICLSNTV